MLDIKYYGKPSPDNDDFTLEYYPYILTLKNLVKFFILYKNQLLAESGECDKSFYSTKEHWKENGPYKPLNVF